MKARWNHYPVFVIATFSVFLLAAVAYLPFAHKFGYYNDDWYLIYSGVSQGSAVFKTIFDIDRPFRGFFVGWMFDLFGVNAPLYSYSAYFMRCLGALGIVWIVRMVWPRERLAAVILGILCVLYPGFLDQPNAIDYQSHIWAYSLSIGSIAFSLYAMKAGLRRWQRISWIVLAVLSQVLALLLMEYYIGLEGLRLLLMLVQVNHLSQETWRKRFSLFLPYWLPFLMGAVGFMVWRQFIFVNQRGATDIQLMFTQLINSPLQEAAWMAVRMLQDLLNVTLMAWTVPVYNLVFSLGLKQFLLAFGLAAAAGLAAWAGLLSLDGVQCDVSNSVDESGKRTAVELAMVGLFSMAAALIPVHLGNRHVIFDGFSRFSLTASIGAGLLLVAFWHTFLAQARLRLAFPIALVVLGVMVHSANSIGFVNRWEVLRDFWWQVSWRVPQFKPGTVLVVDYAGYGVAEDYFVWGPANLIYGAPVVQDYTELPILAATMDKRDLIKAIGQEKDEFDRRSIVSEKDFANLLVLSMANSASCVQVLDEKREVSNLNRIEVIALAPYSHMSRIEAEAALHTPAEDIFGISPAHDWCYFYQTAGLLRQRGDWEEIVNLGEEALAQGLRPNDSIEWLPFIQAYAYTGRYDRMEALNSDIQEVPFLSLQACRLFQNDPDQAGTQFPQGQARLLEAFCD